MGFVVLPGDYSSMILQGASGGAQAKSGALLPWGPKLGLRTGQASGRAHLRHGNRFGALGHHPFPKRPPKPEVLLSFID